MSSRALRVVVADDERPARAFLVDLLRSCDAVHVVGEAGSGEEAVSVIEFARPDLALLDLRMPEMGGLDVVRQLPPGAIPFVAFVTAFDDYAVEAFELNAIDYLLKPVARPRLDCTLRRARERLAPVDPVDSRSSSRPDPTLPTLPYEPSAQSLSLRRIPIRRRDDVILLPVGQIATVVAEAELLHITTVRGERHTITYRLHLLEARLDPGRFVRLGRGVLVNGDLIARMAPMPGGTYVAMLTTGQKFNVSRMRSRVLRNTLLRL